MQPWNILVKPAQYIINIFMQYVASIPFTRSQHSYHLLNHDVPFILAKSQPGGVPFTKSLHPIY